MALTMRPTGLGSGAYQDNIDYNIFSGEWLIGRIYERNGFDVAITAYRQIGGDRLSSSIGTGTPSSPNADCVQSRAKVRNCLRCSSVRALAAHRRQSRAFL